ncbi:MAG TPA: hypothetical protein VHR86_01915, partial [Armatimonadota bacterium]|nr:hypothetical protein [Armatimonadota bacterium]
MPSLQELKQQFSRRAALDIEAHQSALLSLFAALRELNNPSANALNRLMERHVPMPKDRIIESYRQLTAQGVIPFEQVVMDRLRINPVRTISGVAPFAVLTGPYPCPADCIFCPDAKGFPRSYLPEEPGAQRAKL